MGRGVDLKLYLSYEELDVYRDIAVLGDLLDLDGLLLL